jgi:hypothetical protein
METRETFCRRCRLIGEKFVPGKMPMAKTLDRVEYTSAPDSFFDFCLWEYKPVSPPENKLCSSNLLFHSFEFADINGRVYDLIRAIREGFGVSRTVWGVKKLGNDIRWEFYFYDYKRRERERSITRLLDIIRPLVPCDIEADENLHYFMFSVDIDDALVSGKKDLDEVHMYIGNPGSSVSSGICYSLTKRGSRLENFYFFFDAKKQIDDIAAKAICSAHLDDTVIDMDRILWPEMRTAQVIVVSNKQENDAVYFSRINVDQLIFFLRRMGYQREIISFVVRNRSKLDHLLYDAGFDYRMEGKELRILKSGYYGIF